MRSVSRIVLAVAISLAGVFLLQPYRPVIVTGHSMEPTFMDHQLVFSAPLERAPRPGDIVLVQKDGATIIKRVAMVPGDKYTEVRPRLSNSWAMATTARVKRLGKEHKLASRVRTIPNGKIFILGDNPNESLDSRTFGLVPISSIRGVVVPI